MVCLQPTRIILTVPKTGMSGLILRYFLEKTLLSKRSPAKALSRLICSMILPYFYMTINIFPDYSFIFAPHSSYYRAIGRIQNNVINRFDRQYFN